MKTIKFLTVAMLLMTMSCKKQVIQPNEPTPIENVDCHTTHEKMQGDWWMYKIVNSTGTHEMQPEDDSVLVYITADTITVNDNPTFYEVVNDTILRQYDNYGSSDFVIKFDGEEMIWYTGDAVYDEMYFEKL